MLSFISRCRKKPAPAQPVVAAHSPAKATPQGPNPNAKIEWGTLMYTGRHGVTKKALQLVPLPEEHGYYKASVNNERYGYNLTQAQAQGLPQSGWIIVRHEMDGSVVVTRAKHPALMPQSPPQGTPQGHQAGIPAQPPSTAPAEVKGIKKEPAVTCRPFPKAEHYEGEGDEGSLMIICLQSDASILRALDNGVNFFFSGTTESPAGFDQTKFEFKIYNKVVTIKLDSAHHHIMGVHHRDTEIWGGSIEDAKKLVMLPKVG